MVLDLMKFPCMVKYKNEPLTGTRLLKIGTFSKENVDVGSYHYNLQYADIPIIVATQILELVKSAEMKWIIGESHGGLYIELTMVQNSSDYEIIYQVEMFVYVPADIYTFCQLKYSENLTAMRR